MNLVDADVEGERNRQEVGQTGCRRQMPTSKVRETDRKFDRMLTSKVRETDKWLTGGSHNVNGWRFLSRFLTGFDRDDENKMAVDRGVQSDFIHWKAEEAAK